MDPAVPKVRVPPVYHSWGDSRGVSSFERPTHTCVAVQYHLSSNLKFIAVFSDGRTIYISLRRATNGHICTLDSGGVQALHL
jgi:hypothetical protein